jgi:hypothetical protein
MAFGRSAPILSTPVPNPRRIASSMVVLMSLSRVGKGVRGNS